MNPRTAINFFRRPVGAFTGFCVMVAIALFVTHHFQKPHQKNSSPPVNSAGAAQAPSLVQSVQENMQAYNPPPVQWSSATERREQKPALPPISLFNYTPSGKGKSLSLLYAPYGRLIPCELVVTVDSSTIRTPIIGLTTEGVYYHGHLIIPAGTEIHGVAQLDRVRERIASANRWILVLPNGQELTLTGIVLDRQSNPDGTGWGITDGSAGLRGQLIKSDNMAEIKLFAASFLSAAGATLNQNQQTLLGYQLLPNTQNAALAGAQSVLAAYAKQIYDSIQKNGFYVRVPAGKQFYLYVTQTIDRGEAAAGESRSQPNGINNPPSTPARPEFSPIQSMQP
ncbi:MAG: TrbI/VirB10 family protein [Verrucomicrobiota bacterium]|nr:TrbI/VirB10 family protein [Verrucomicrobiota bacterium]